MKRAFTLIGVLIVGTVVALLIMIVVTACNKAMNAHQQDQELYEAWCKVERRTDISFEEWEKLRHADMIGNHRTK